MTSLVSLSLNENHITELPPELSKLTCLQLLGLYFFILIFYISEFINFLLKENNLNI